MDPQKIEKKKELAKKKAAQLDRLIGLNRQRVLEIGTQRGFLSVEMAEQYNCEVVGIDIMEYPTWEKANKHPNVRLVNYDLTDGSKIFSDNQFTRIISTVVWEHIRHPFTALTECQRILHPKGKKYLHANLYRSTLGSHLYDQIEEPYPHLLYSPDELVKKFNVSLGWAFWLNKLTYSHYLFYFKKLGFYITYERLRQREIDSVFYQKNEKRLGLYPEFDLKTDFFEVVLEFDREKPKAPIKDPLYKINSKS